MRQNRTTQKICSSLIMVGNRYAYTIPARHMAENRDQASGRNRHSDYHPCLREPQNGKKVINRSSVGIRLLLLMLRQILHSMDPLIKGPVEDCAFGSTRARHIVTGESYICERGWSYPSPRAINTQSAGINPPVDTWNADSGKNGRTV